jgi:hypothetical protein
VQAHGLSDLDPATLNRMSLSTLIDLIVTGVRLQQTGSARSSRS